MKGRINRAQAEGGTGTPVPAFCRCGSAEGLDAGRQSLRKWGFRRCEDTAGSRLTCHGGSISLYML